MAFQCVFVFISPFSTLPRSSRPLPLLLRPAWPVPPRPARSTSAGLLGCTGRRASHYPRRSGAHGGRHCRGGGGQLLAWLPSLPPARLVWRGRRARQPIPEAGRAGAGPPGAGPALPGGGGTAEGAASAAAQAHGPRPFPGRPGISGHLGDPAHLVSSQQGTLRVIPAASSASLGSSDRPPWGPAAAGEPPLPPLGSPHPRTPASRSASACKSPRSNSPSDLHRKKEASQCEPSPHFADKKTRQAKGRNLPKATQLESSRAGTPGGSGFKHQALNHG